MAGGCVLSFYLSARLVLPGSNPGPATRRRAEEWSVNHEIHLVWPRDRRVNRSPDTDEIVSFIGLYKGIGMGARSLIEVKSGGSLRVAQYSQFDGYPTGQGRDIAKFLHSGYDKESMAEALRNCRWFVDEDRPVVDAANQRPGTDWSRFLPQFNRVTGAFILWLIYGTRGRGLVLDDDSNEKGGPWIEYHWLIDFDSETVSMNGETPVPFAEFTEEWCVNRKRELAEA